ncbi:MAG: serine/threonine-protein phosphatase [Deltaproteobacteria bacterium]|nr:serine/threonine-protein phosphatase [Deltaproteobacteria bacterium]
MPDPPCPPRMTVGVVCSLGIGPEKGGRKHNEDNYLVCCDGEIRWREGDGEAVHPASGHSVLLAVADGMGGHEDGAWASASAVQAMAGLYTTHPDMSPELALHRFFLATHRRLHNSLAHDGCVRSGTTLACAWIVGSRLAWIHVGDSRIYLFRGDVLERLTREHTRRLFAQRDRRRIPTDPDQLAQNFIFGSRGLGDNAGIRIDPGLDSGAFPLRPEDRILACSDGLWGFVGDEDIAEVLKTVPAPADCARMLVDRALECGSDDNVTALVARVERLGRKDPSGPMRLRAADTFAPW